RVLAAPVGAAPGDEEVRQNRSTYETIRSKGLYSVEGLEAASANAKSAGLQALVKFDPQAKEDKAQWIILKGCNPYDRCPDKARYHWRLLTSPTTNAREVWGLAALHVITKDLPNWVWADFGHIDCEKGQGPCSEFAADDGNDLRDFTTTKD